VTGVSGLLLLVAVGLLAYPVYTNYLHNRTQGHLRKELASSALKDDYLNHRVKEGDSLTRLKIPKLGVDVVVVQGVSESALRAGAGHYPATALPCDVGNVAIAGHRTTYGKPFANVDQLVQGDQITLETPVGTCTYQMTKAPYVVLPNDISVVADAPGEHLLTLTSCTPKGSASHRIIIRASMIQSTPA